MPDVAATQRKCYQQHLCIGESADARGIEGDSGIGMFLLGCFFPATRELNPSARMRLRIARSIAVFMSLVDL